MIQHVEWHWAALLVSLSSRISHLWWSKESIKPKMNSPQGLQISRDRRMSALQKERHEESDREKEGRNEKRLMYSLVLSLTDLAERRRY